MHALASSPAHSQLFFFNVAWEKQHGLVSEVSQSKSRQHTNAWVRHALPKCHKHRVAKSPNSGGRLLHRPPVLPLTIINLPFFLLSQLKLAASTNSASMLAPNQSGGVMSRVHADTALPSHAIYSCVCVTTAAINLLARWSWRGSAPESGEGTSEKRTKYLCKFQQDWTKKDPVPWLCNPRVSITCPVPALCGTDFSVDACGWNDVTKHKETLKHMELIKQSRGQSQVISYFREFKLPDFHTNL